jgi:hypothetical protein
MARRSIPQDHLQGLLRVAVLAEQASNATLTTESALIVEGLYVLHLPPLRDRENGANWTFRFAPETPSVLRAAVLRHAQTLQARFDLAVQPSGH